MTESFEMLVKSTRLTKIEQRVADYILANQAAVCFMTATEVARALDVSDSSVIRLCRSLGFKGYPALQHHLQSQLSDTLQSSSRRFLAPYSRLGIQMEADSQELLSVRSCYENLINNINSTFERINPQALIDAANCIISAKRKYILGFRGSAGLADYMDLISHMLADVRCYNDSDADVICGMLDCNGEDCVILFSIERYSKMACIAADMARESGSKLIVVTDRMTSPVAFNADHVLIGGVQSTSVFHSFTALYAIVEVLISQIARITGYACKERLERMEKYISQVQLF